MRLIPDGYAYQMLGQFKDEFIWVLDPGSNLATWFRDSVLEDRYVWLVEPRTEETPSRF
jgi:hypothetical protein